MEKKKKKKNTFVQPFSRVSLGKFNYYLKYAYIVKNMTAFRKTVKSVVDPQAYRENYLIFSCQR